MVNAQEAKTYSTKIETFQNNTTNTRGLDPNGKGSEAIDYGDSPGWSNIMIMKGEVYPHESLQYKVQTWYDPSGKGGFWDKYGIEPNYEVFKKTIVSLIYGDWQNPEDGTWHHTYLTAEDFRFMRDSLPNLYEVRMCDNLEIRAYEGTNGTLNGYHKYSANEIPPHAFDKSYNIKNLKRKVQYSTIILPKGTTSIAEFAFANIIDIYLDSKEQWYKSFGKENRFWRDEYDGYIYLSDLKNLTTIKTGAFHNTISTRVHLPENLESIGENAFNSDIIKDRPINTNLDSIIVNSQNPPMIAENSFGKKFNNAKILIPNKNYMDYRRNEFWGLSKNLTYTGYVSPNPVDIKLDKGVLIINIKNEATEAGTVSIFQGEKKVTEMGLKTGNNTVPLDSKMEYEILIDNEKFNLKPYKVNVKK